MGSIGAFSEGGFRLGLLIAAFWFGFRHGIDWDHIAAITDITSSQEERRQAMLFGTLYALGHALVVFVLGILAIAIGERLPDSVDNVMTRVVGVTLLLLGVYVFVSLIRHGRDFRLRSRWMLVFAGVRKGVRWARSKVRTRTNGGHDGWAEEARVSEGEPDSVEAPTWHHGHHGRPGHHHHARPEADDTFMNYGRGTAFGVGMIHGIGAETPTQVLIFLSAAGAGGTGVGILVLLAFIVGLLASNSLITLGSAMGFLRASKNFPIYAAVAVITGVFSLVIGTIFVLGKTTLLPALFGG
jgi:High-affinity nickel-transport protein